MDELIFRKDAIGMVCEGCAIQYEDEPCEPSECYIQDNIKAIPAVDAVLVVRCKDCAVPHNRWTGCPKMNGTIMPPDGFCSFGERKADHDG